MAIYSADHAKGFPIQSQNDMWKESLDFLTKYNGTDLAAKYEGIQLARSMIKVGN